MSEADDQQRADAQSNANLEAIKQICAGCLAVNPEHTFGPCNHVAKHGIGWIKRQAKNNRSCPDKNLATT